MNHNIKKKKRKRLRTYANMQAVPVLQKEERQTCATMCPTPANETSLRP